MSTETLNTSSVITEEFPQNNSGKQFNSQKRVNIEVLKKRIFEKKKKERFMNRVIMGTFCLSVAILGYIVV